LNLESLLLVDLSYMFILILVVVGS
jgi:hypothetical protein